MQCPSCHKEVTVEEKNIGALFTCPQCQSVYFINFDGTPDYGQPEETDKEHIESLIKSQTQSQIEQQNTPIHQDPVFNLENTIEEQVQENELQQNKYNPPDFDQSFEVADVNIESLSALPISEETQQAVSQELNSAFNEIQSFGNQESQLSAISYSLTISEIDTVELQNQVFEILSDQKLRLNIEILKRQIQTGYVEFNKLSGVQAHIIMRQLHLLKLSVKWVQYVLSS